MTDQIHPPSKLNTYPLRSAYLSEVLAWAEEFVNKNNFDDFTYEVVADFVICEVTPKDDSVITGFEDVNKTINFKGINEVLNFICLHDGIDPGVYLIEDFPESLKREIYEEEYGESYDSEELPPPDPSALTNVVRNFSDYKSKKTEGDPLE